MFDKGWLGSQSFAIPMICVGNLAVGGTGKSPMVEWLIRTLSSQYNIATLSRGYKRKTRGYVLAGPGITAIDIGDEPMQFHRKFPDIAVAVGEKRVEAVPQLLHDRPNTQLIILDDAFQHRRIRAGLNMLLTDYHHLFTRDYLLPAGMLRDNRSSYKRADIIVVTKCDENLSEEKQLEIREEINPLAHQKLYFSSIAYGRPYHIFTKEDQLLDRSSQVLLVEGIANATPLTRWLADTVGAYQMMHYPDHHIYTIDDWRKIKKTYESMEGRKLILTTEKDAVRLVKFGKELDGFPLYVLPIRPKILGGEEEPIAQIVKYIEKTPSPATTGEGNS